MRSQPIQAKNDNNKVESGQLSFCINAMKDGVRTPYSPTPGKAKYYRHDRPDKVQGYQIDEFITINQVRINGERYGRKTMAFAILKYKLANNE